MIDNKAFISLIERGLPGAGALGAAVRDRLARHAAAVCSSPRHLHLTAIREPREILTRHVAEALVALPRLDVNARGTLLDLGSGNGYPGLALAIAHGGLRPVLTEASRRKAEFLRELIAELGVEGGVVVDRQVARPADLADHDLFDVLTTRAMGSWEKIVPRLRGCLRAGADVFVWAGADSEAVFARTVWRAFELVEVVPIAGTERSRVFHLKRA